MKVYQLTIVFDEKTEEIEYIEEEITEDTPTVMYKVQLDPEYYDYETKTKQGTDKKANPQQVGSDLIADRQQSESGVRSLSDSK